MESSDWLIIWIPSDLYVLVPDFASRPPVYLQCNYTALGNVGIFLHVINSLMAVEEQLNVVLTSADAIVIPPLKIGILGMSSTAGPASTFRRRDSS